MTILKKIGSIIAGKTMLCVILGGLIITICVVLVQPAAKSNKTVQTNHNVNKDSKIPVKPKSKPVTTNSDKWNVGIPAYVVCDLATKSEDEATRRVQSLKDRGYDAGYLWIPDYRSLSGNEYFLVYVGPFKTKEDCRNMLQRYKEVNRTAYGILVSQQPNRVEVR